ncbi:MAG: phosphotransferase [Silicimonas sp.]|nr:phosphotransferase [Silicimonas sp.]NNL34204.1 phosphotransferase [Silicimonas sp.]
MDRPTNIDGFLSQAGWLDAERQPLAADLSRRAYTRLVKPGVGSAVLMDAPPDRDTSTPAFVEMTNWLRNARLNAPEIYASDIESGLLLLEDFGDTQIAKVIGDNPENRAALYGDILDVLILIRSQEPPPLHCPDAAELTTLTVVADTHYPGAVPLGLTRFRAVLSDVMATLLKSELSVSLRDFHASNIMWLPQRPGLQRFGLLDYQDAFLTHSVYDLVSLLTDARTDISKDFRERMIAEYQSRTGDDMDQVRLAFSAFSAQRNLRILGVFARAAKDQGKPAHLDKMPRVHRYFAEALQHPVFADVLEETLDAVPFPTAELLESLK